MARFRVYRGSLSILQEDGSRKDYVVGDELEMSIEEGLRRQHQITLIDQALDAADGVAVDEAASNDNDSTATISTVDWPHILKSSSVSKILLLVKNVTDRNELSSALDAEQKGSNRAKVTEAINLRMSTVDGVS